MQLVSRSLTSYSLATPALEDESKSKHSNFKSSTSSHNSAVLL